MDADSRSFRVALTSDQYVNPRAGGLDGLAILAGAGWGVMQLPPEGYPAPVAAALLREVAEQAEEFWRRGYDVVVVGEHPGLAEALAEAGMPAPPGCTPSTAEELRAFLLSRPSPAAATTGPLNHP